MDIHHLKYFVEVARQKNFSKAANINHISQSAISKMVKDLEVELGVALLNRNSKSVQLTDAGIIFFEKAQQVVSLFDNLTSEFESEFKLERGKIVIGLPPITEATVFAQLLGEFRNKYPQIDIELYEYGSKKIELAIQEGTLDFGIICSVPDVTVHEFFSLTNDPLNVIINVQHPLSANSELTLSALANESFVIYRDDFSLHDEIISNCKIAGFQPRIIFETSQRDLMVQTVVANLGIAFLASKLCSELDTKAITAIPLVCPQIWHRLSVIWKKGRHLSHAAQLWLSFARKHLLQ
ncbi:MAG: transcriptional regulator, LysR family [Sporomusa sp.]|jgi:DNA-binding transcriptional LysR family regulator|nr:transcriptional regulator, LysR family [Sporomusa sp.]